MVDFRFPRVEAHVVEIGGCRLLMGPFAGVFMTVNEVGAELIQHCEGKTVEECKQWVRERFGEKQTSTVDMLVSIAERGYLRSLDPETPTPAPDAPGVGFATLCLTHKCQMACRYCFARELRTDQNLEDMTYETACAAVRFFVDRAAEGGLPMLNLVFTSSGESFLKIDLMADVCAYAKKYAGATGFPVYFHAATNGLMVDPDTIAKACNWNTGYIGLSVSWDGPPEIHNRQRMRQDGSGTYDGVAQAFHMIRRLEGMMPAVGTTLSSMNPDLPRIFSHLFDQGARQIVIKPVREVGSDLAVSEDTLPTYKAAYDEFAEYLLRTDAFHTERLTTFAPTDFFWRFVVRLVDRGVLTYRCPGGRSTVCVDTNGDIYPCQDFLGMPEYKLGDVFTGFDGEARAVYMEDLTVYKMEPCKTCWARYLCGGGCHSQSAKAFNRLDVPYPPDCELVKHLIELAAYFVTRMEKQRPGFLKYVMSYRDLEPVPDPRPVALCHRADGDLWSRPIDDWRTSDPIVLDSESQVGGSKTWRGPDDLSASIHLRWDESSLYVLAEVRDGVFTPATVANSEWWFHDSLQIAIDPENNGGISPDPWRLTGNDREFGIASINGEATRFDCHVDRSRPVTEWQASVERTDTGVVYRASIPWQHIPEFAPAADSECGFTVVVNDSDRAGRRWLQWTPGIAKTKTPGCFGLLRLV